MVLLSYIPVRCMQTTSLPYTFTRCVHMVVLVQTRLYLSSRKQLKESLPYPSELEL